MQDNRRWVLISLVVGTALLWGTGFLLMRQLNAMFRLSTLIPYGDVVVQVLPVVIAAGTFFWIFRSSQKMEFLDEVVGETSKVTFPSRKDTVASTIVVVITILIIAAILGVYDAVCNWVIQKVI